MVSSTCRWSDAGEWESAQPFTLPHNEFGIYGRRCRTPTRFVQPAYERMAVRNHINRITVKVRTTLQRQADTQTFEKIANRATVDAFANTAILYLKLRHQGPPLHIALDWVGSRSNRAAVAALFGGDFFFSGVMLGTILPRAYSQDAVTIQNSRQATWDLLVSVCTAGIIRESSTWKTNHMYFSHAQLAQGNGASS